MPRVLITQPTMLAKPNGPWRAVVESAGFEIVLPASGVDFRDASALPTQLKGIDAVLATTEPYNAQVLATTDTLRAICRVGVGYDSIDLAAASQRNIAVTITPGANEISVAEQTLAMLLALSRGYPHRDLLVRRGEWARTPLPRLAGQTLGLIGLGRIGRAVALRALPLGMKVIAHDPLPDAAFAAAQKIEFVGLDDLLRRSDYVSLHCVCTPETTDLINAQTLAQMKRGAALINSARGGLVDEPALIDALKTGHLSAAALDVFKTEPLPADSPFLSLDNVLLSPHTAGLDYQSELDMNRMAAECLIALFQDRWPEGCVVNDEIRHRYRW